MGKRTPSVPNSSPYSVHPGVAMVQQWIADLPRKTGKTLEEWVALVQASGRTFASYEEAYAYASSDRMSLQLDSQPPTPLGLVAPDFRSLAENCHDSVKSAVVVEIGDRQTSVRRSGPDLL